MENIQIREIQISYNKPHQIYSHFRSASDVVEFLREIAPNNSQEHLIAVYLDGGHKPIAYSVVCTGLATSCPVHPREVYQRAILCGAYSVVLAHNHPSGDLRPSAEDQKVTAQMKVAAETLGLKLLDHIIFTDDGYYSFQSDGKI
jgi:DNA repair protein RadC